MDPFTILTLFSAGASLVGGLLQAGAASDESARTQAELERSARQADAARLDSIRRGNLAEAQRRMEVGRIRAAQQVGYAKAGVDASTGTPADVAMATERAGELDALTLRANAMREAFGHQETARALRLKKQQAKAQGEAAVFNAVLGGSAQAATGLLPLFKKGA